MPEEMLEILDEKGAVIGLEPRSHFHDRNRAQKLLHRAVHVYVIDFATNKFWIQKRSLTMDLYPGYWDPCVAGHVDPGETAEQTALRELTEEYSLEADKVFPLGEHTFQDEFQRQTCCLFWLKTSKTPVKSSEASELKLSSLDEIEKMLSEDKVPPQYARDFKIIREKKLV